MNTLTVERLKDLRDICLDRWSQFQPRDITDILSLIDAHLSPSAELGRMGGEIDVRVTNLLNALDAKQAKIDALMFEFCPGEMSAEQRAEYARNQRVGIDSPIPPGTDRRTVFAIKEARRTPPPPADVQAVVEELNTAIDEYAHAIRSYDRSIDKYTKAEIVDARARIIALLQRPFSEELLKAAAWGYEQGATRFIGAEDELPSTAKLVAKEYLTRAAEGKGP